MAFRPAGCCFLWLAGQRLAGHFAPHAQTLLGIFEGVENEGIGFEFVPGILAQ